MRRTVRRIAPVIAAISGFCAIFLALCGEWHSANDAGLSTALWATWAGWLDEVAP